MYIYQLKKWPHFTWDQASVAGLLRHLHIDQGRLLGKMEELGFTQQQESLLDTITNDVVKSSEIEGEMLDDFLVRSSIARHLNIDVACSPTVDRNIEGIVELTLEGLQNYDEELNKKRIFLWHNLLFPQGRSHFSKITVGRWRKGNVEVISGQIGREKIHFEAQSADQVEKEMSDFFRWFNSECVIEPLIKAAIAHLWFITIHPFDDGNGRIARALTDLQLARAENSSQRFYSMSAQIQKKRKEYYEILEQTQKGPLDITPWLTWFLKCLLQAIEIALETVKKVLDKAQYWESLKNIPLNPRQTKVVNCLPEGLEGNLTTSKWAKITNCSQDSAYRDILDLIDKKVMKKNLQSGRSTTYSLEKPHA